MKLCTVADRKKCQGSTEFKQLSDTEHQGTVVTVGAPSQKDKPIRLPFHAGLWTAHDTFT